MKNSYLKRNWRKLDNAAKIFSLDDKENMNIFRFSVILKEKVDKDILEKAVEKTLKCCSAFRVKMKTGIFWNYLQFNTRRPVVEQDSEISCKYIDFKTNNDYLFKVTYEENKINLDIFHVLADGVGAIQFLKMILYEYFNLKYHYTNNQAKNNYHISYQDHYIENYDKTLKAIHDLKPAYQLGGKRERNKNYTFRYEMNVEEIKKVCSMYHVTITEYLTSIYIYAIYLSLYNAKSNKEICITVPIDLRKYYQVDTLSNFFVCMNINSKMQEKKITTFEELLMQVHGEFQEKLRIDNIKSYLTRDVKLGLNIPIRLVPLPLKKLFIKFWGHLLNKSTTSTLSNVGMIDMELKYKGHIDNIYALVIPGKNQKVKCTICSFDTKVNVTINANIEINKFQQAFLNQLKQKLKNVKLEETVQKNGYI